jgi:hypothetical protein
MQSPRRLQTGDLALPSNDQKFVELRPYPQVSVYLILNKTQAEAQNRHKRYSKPTRTTSATRSIRARLFAASRRGDALNTFESEGRISSRKISPEHREIVKLCEARHVAAQADLLYSRYGPFDCRGARDRNECSVLAM